MKVLGTASLPYSSMTPGPHPLSRLGTWHQDHTPCQGWVLGTRTTPLVKAGYLAPGPHPLSRLGTWHQDHTPCQGWALGTRTTPLVKAGHLAPGPHPLSRLGTGLHVLLGIELCDLGVWLALDWQYGCGYIVHWRIVSSCFLSIGGYFTELVWVCDM